MQGKIDQIELKKKMIHLNGEMNKLIKTYDIDDFSSQISTNSTALPNFLSLMSI